MDSTTAQQAAQHHQRIAQVFDQASGGYGSPAPRFFPFAADRVVARLAPRPGWTVLDAASGPGDGHRPLRGRVGARRP